MAFLQKLWLIWAESLIQFGFFAKLNFLKFYPKFLGLIHGNPMSYLPKTLRKQGLTLGNLLPCPTI